MINFVTCEGSTCVGGLKHGDTFMYTAHAYMRVSSCISSGSGTPSGVGKYVNRNMNTEDACLVLKLSNGRISYFKRNTRVREVNLNVEIVEK